MQPGVAQISQDNIGTRNDEIANDVSDRYMSKQDDKYLQKLAGEVSGHYVDGDSLQNVLAEMRKQPPARREKAAFELKWMIASLAGLLFLAAYLPKHPVKEIKLSIHEYLVRRKRQSTISSGTAKPS